MPFFGAATLDPAMLPSEGIPPSLQKKKKSSSTKASTTKAPRRKSLNNSLASDSTKAPRRKSLNNNLASGSTHSGRGERNGPRKSKKTMRKQRSSDASVTTATAAASVTVPSSDEFSEAMMIEKLEPVTEATIRKSIKKYFPLGQVMSKGQNNPITLHSVNQDAFARVWSLMAEIMVAEGALSRSTKEDIALMVSSKNQCPMCMTAHRMMGAAAKRAESAATKSQEEKERRQAFHLQAMNYAEHIIDETMKATVAKKEEEEKVGGEFHLPTSVISEGSSSESSTAAASEEKEDYSLLSDAAKVEAALVVALYNHMNRIISAVLGEQMSTAMFSVPEGAAKKMESSSVMGVVNKVMAPFLAGSMKAHQPGITSNLFHSHGNSNSLDTLPESLQGAAVAGKERGLALARVYAWVIAYEDLMVAQHIVTPDILNLLDDPANRPPPGTRSTKMAQWATTDMRKVIKKLPNDESRALANVLLLVGYSPQSVYHSIHWQTVLESVGSDLAKSLVVWWSLRFCLRRAQGLDAKAFEGEHTHSNIAGTL